MRISLTVLLSSAALMVSMIHTVRATSPSPVHVIPEPRKIEFLPHSFTVTPTTVIVIGRGSTFREYFTAEQLSFLTLKIINEGRATLPANSIILTSDTASEYVQDAGLSFSPEMYKEGYALSILARYNYNVYSPYIEDIFVFKKYPSIWQNRGALTHEQVEELEDYAHQFHIEIIPVFETLGHFENILIKPEYVKCAEFPGAQVLNTTSEEAYSFLMDLIDDIAPAFRSPYFANAIPDIQYAAQSGYLAGAKGLSVSNYNMVIIRPNFTIRRTSWIER